MLNRKEFENQLKNFAGDVIFNRGLNYFKIGKVKNISVSLEGKTIILIKGKVDGTELYDTELSFDMETENFYSMECDCPYHSICKHSVALGLEFIDIYKQFYEEEDLYTNYFDVEAYAQHFIYWFKNKHKKKNNLLTEKLTLAGIDVSKIPDNLLNKLKQTLELNTKENVINEKKEKIEKFNIKKYWIIIDFESYGVYCSLKNKDSGHHWYNHYNHTSLEREILNNFKKDLTKSEKKFFNILASDNGRFDFKMFQLANEIGIDLYSESKIKRNKLEIIDNPKKLRANLIYKYNLKKAEQYDRDSFVFNLEEPKKNIKYIKDVNGLIKIENKEISLYNLHSELTYLIIRMDLVKLNKNDGYYHKKSFSEFLTKGEVIKINEIIKQAKEVFDFSMNFKEKFKIEKSEKANKVIGVDFDVRKNRLEVFPMVDYEYSFVNISKSVYFSTANDFNDFKRRFDYDYTGKKDDIILTIQEGSIKYNNADENKEVEFYKELFKNHEYYGFTPRLKQTRNTKKKLYEFHETYLPRLKELDLDIIQLGEELNFETSNFKVDFKVDMNAENDWLHFDVDCYCGKNKVGLSDLKSFVESGDDFLKLKDGRLLKITNKDELEHFVTMLESFHAKKLGGYEGKLYNAPELQNVFTKSDYYNAQVSESFDKFIKEANSGKPVDKAKISEKFRKILRDYQKEGIDWFYFLRKYRFAGILADDMGLGKTLQTLILIQKEKVKNLPSIVICPKTLLYNWEDEVKKFTPRLKTIVVDGIINERKEMLAKIKKYDLIITSYSVLKNDFEEYKKRKLKFNYCIIDESQYIKNYKTKTAQTVKKIDADYRLALTGTPLENTVTEIWSIFDFLMPGFLGSHNFFVKNFETPIMKNSSVEALKSLREKTKCFMLRRTKKEVLCELPPKIEQASYCELGNDQNILYQEILANVKSEIFKTIEKEGFAKSQIHILAGLTKLRQVCNHPTLLLKNKDYKKYESAKLNLCMELVDEIVNSNRKVLIFSQFTKMLDILKEEMKIRQIKYSYLSGKTRNRKETIKNFNEDKDRNVFLISLRAGGVGLNLTSADNVIIFDPWWNPSVENQAIDRTHRIGQKKSVNVYRLITKGTIEEKIVALQVKKKYLFDNLVGESKELFKKLTWNDVKKLFE
ncbi:hypothetical protein KAI92_02990 [Candidatus Parcubacteria bacterium]|nr:hypothetical protein [Candidatus Parcubacteria bacterium]